MSVLYIRDAQGKFVPVPALQGKSAYQYAQDGGYTGTEAEFAEKLAEEVYSKAETDAAISEATKEDEYELIKSFVASENTTGVIIDEDMEGNPFELVFATLIIKCFADVEKGSTSGTIGFSTPTSSMFARVYTVNWQYPGYKVSDTYTRPSSVTVQCDIRNDSLRIDGVYGDEGAIGNNASRFSSDMGKPTKNESITRIVAENFIVPKNAQIYLYGIRKVKADA